MARLLTIWNPEDQAFWSADAKKIAKRNLWISIPALFLAFAIWMVWSAIIVKLPKIGFTFSTEQLFWLTALPGLSGATLRIFYSFMVPIFGGRRWTALSTASLAIPAIGIGIAVQDLSTPYHIFVILALLCGVGGGNFASSMANISYFFPKSEKGNALALNAGLGNLGVSAVQFVAPIIMTVGAFGMIGGTAQLEDGQQVWLQNAAYVWVPLILLATVAAWWGMNDIANAKASLATQMEIFKRPHTWIICILYVGTFGSFIGFSAGFPLLAKTQFPEVNVMQLAFLGPLVGALARAGSGWVADKYGGGRVTIAVFAALIVGALGVFYFLLNKDQPHAFYGFFGMFLLLFAATGVGNASTFQMIPAIFRIERTKALQGVPKEDIQRAIEREAAATIGFSSAIGAFGAFFIPKSFGTSIALTGTPEAALLVFCFYYGICLGITWWCYTRKKAKISC